MSTTGLAPHFVVFGVTAPDGSASTVEVRIRDSVLLEFFIGEKLAAAVDLAVLRRWLRSPATTLDFDPIIFVKRNGRVHVIYEWRLAGWDEITARIAPNFA